MTTNNYTSTGLYCDTNRDYTVASGTQYTETNLFGQASDSTGAVQTNGAR
jgi:hypothetical protein